MLTIYKYYPRYQEFVEMVKNLVLFVPYEVEVRNSIIGLVDSPDTGTASEDDHIDINEEQYEFLKSKGINTVEIFV